MTMRPIYGQNFRPKFFNYIFYIYLAIDRKSSKTIITREGQRMVTNLFRVLLVSSSPTYGQNMNAIGD